MLKEALFKELVKRGYSKENGKRVWDVSNQLLLFSSPDLSQAFLNLRKFSVYRKNVGEREIDLIKESKSTLVSVLHGSPFNLIDMRCITGERASLLLKMIPKTNVRYCPVNSNVLLTDSALHQVKKQKLANVSEYAPQKTDFENFGAIAGMLRNGTYQRNVILLFGSTLATFEINDFLFNLSREMFKGDILIIGNGIRTGRRLVHLEVYQNKVFDNWFIHLMHSLGFKDSELTYHARFGNSRVECFYTLLVDKTIEFEGKKISFKKGDTVIVAVIYKYYAKELEQFCKMYFPEGEFLKDDDNEYALLICKK